MAKTDFYKVNGAKERQDRLIKLSEKNYLLIFGFSKENESDESGWHWRKNYDHMPTVAELKSDIFKLINQATDFAILTKFVWNGKPVYLSQENQMNFKAAYDLAFQTGGATLPIKFKLGEDSEEKPVYHSFQKIESFTDFYTKAVAHVNACINEGWREKDSIDWEKLTAEDE